jgi:FixJ family two-component response regulator
MPGLDGAQLGAQAKLMRPNLHVIFITGFADAALDAKAEVVLHKPIRAEELLQVVDRKRLPR